MIFTGVINCHHQQRIMIKMHIKFVIYMSTIYSQCYAIMGHENNSI